MKKLLFVLIALLLAVAPADAKRRKARSAGAVPRLTASDARRLSYCYQEGIKQKLAGRLTEAHDLFQHCLYINPDDPDVLYELAYLKFYTGQDSLGTELFRRVVELDGSNPRYVQMLAAAYLARNENDKAIPYVERLSQLQSRRSDVLYQLVELYKANGQTDDAISALDRIELLEGRTMHTGLQKYSLYLDKGEKENAYGVLVDLQKENPYDLRISLICGRCYLENNDPEKALECFEAVRETDPENDDLRLAMMEYYERIGQSERSIHLRDSLLYAPRTSPELRRSLTNMVIQELNATPETRERIRPMLDSLVRLSSTVEMYTVRTAYLMKMQASPDTIALSLRDLLRVDPLNDMALSRLLVYYLSEKDMENVMEICRMGINAHPESLMFYLYLGIAQSQLKQTEQALETLHNGLRQVNENASPEHVSEIYEILGELYNEQGRWQESSAAYDSCLVYNSENAMALNNYAYYLSLRNERLDEAEKMAYRAIKLAPLSKTCLDTYAWVLFMQENYIMAKFYIDRVVSPSAPDSLLLADEEIHADLLEHAGDIYIQNGLEVQALRYWSLALQKGSESALLEEKLKQKKYLRE